MLRSLLRSQSLSLLHKASAGAVVKLPFRSCAGAVGGKIDAVSHDVPKQPYIPDPDDASTIADASRSTGPRPPEDMTLEQHNYIWERMNYIYFTNPQRDHVNFPIHEWPEDHPPVRMAIIPDHWFQLFYEKTGVTGPYCLFVGGFIFALSKEWWVVCHFTADFMVYWPTIYILAFLLGPKMVEIVNAKYDYEVAYQYDTPLRIASENIEMLLEANKKTIKQQAAQTCLFNAKRENIGLQLETEYRRRMDEAAKAVTKRLDYHIEKDSGKRQAEQQHMVQWIIDTVKKSITPEQEKQSIVQCVEVLKKLAARS